MKKRALLSILFLFAWIGVWLFPMQVNPLSNVTSFSIFYDYPTDEVISSLKNVDVAILAVHAFSKDQIQELQDSGTRVYAYTSLMQLENWNTPLVDQVEESDYATVNGGRIAVPEWDTYVMDIRQPHYQAILLSKMRAEQLEKGIDGVFFDTVDDLYHYFHDTPEHTSYQQAYRDILQETKDLQLDIIQNRGFETFHTSGVSLVSGILWENFDTQTLNESPWAQNWLEQLRTLHSRHTIRLLTEVRTDEAKQLSHTLGFPTYDSRQKK